MKALGFPLVPGDTPLFNEIPLQVFPVAKRARFVTVSTCSGTEHAAREMETRTRGAVENMEGAAIAHVAHLHGIPVWRGPWNQQYRRLTATRSTWRLQEAAEAAQHAIIDWLASPSAPQDLKTLRPQP